MAAQPLFVPLSPLPLQLVRGGILVLYFSSGNASVENENFFIVPLITNNKVLPFKKSYRMI